MSIGFKVGNVLFRNNPHTNLLKNSFIPKCFREINDELTTQINSGYLKGEYINPIRLEDSVFAIIYVNTELYKIPFFIQYSNPGNKISKAFDFDTLCGMSEKTFDYFVDQSKATVRLPMSNNKLNGTVIRKIQKSASEIAIILSSNDIGEFIEDITNAI